MRQRIISVAPNLSTDDFLAERILLSVGPFRFERVAWRTLSLEVLIHSDARLLILHVGSERECGIRVFHCLKQQAVPLPVLALLPANPDQELFELAAEACGDVLMDPIRTDEFQQRAVRLLNRGRNDSATVRDHLMDEAAFANLIGEEPVFVRQVDQVRACAGNEYPVLITGETGTGKEVFARAIHQIGTRRGGAFIPIDCGAIPDHLLENELFGHSRGAFTDAHKDQKGLVRLASGGTLLLDEVDSLSFSAQAKILRLIQERTYRPLGADTFLRADVKIIAASNRDLEIAVERKQFRSDLFYRLNVLRLQLPPLRERRADIPVLAGHFLRTEHRLEGRAFSSEAMEMLQGYSWPGNIRELLNVVQRAIAYSRSTRIEASAIPLPRAPADDPEGTTFREARRLTIEEFERTFVTQLLEKHGGNITRAAREAGKDRRVFGRMAKKYGVGQRSSSADA